MAKKISCDGPAFVLDKIRSGSRGLPDGLFTGEVFYALCAANRFIVDFKHFYDLRVVRTLKKPEDFAPMVGGSDQLGNCFF